MIIRVKGGPGSGHHGHRGRPGKRGGSLPGKSVGVVGPTKIIVVGDVDPDVVTYIAAQYSYIPEWARADVKELVISSAKGYDFDAGGQTFEAGGDWNARTGTIHVYSANRYATSYDPHTRTYSRLSVRKLLAHEVGHSLENKWWSTANKQHRDAYDEHPGWFNKSGHIKYVKPEFWALYKQAYPESAAQKAFLDAWAKGQDGITSYSAAWAADGVISETIAEMASIYFTYGGDSLMAHSHSVGANGLGLAFLDAMRAMERRYYE